MIDRQNFQENMLNEMDVFKFYENYKTKTLIFNVFNKTFMFTNKI